MESTTSNSPLFSKLFECEKCNYKCCKKSDFNKHLHSIKHNTTNTTKLQPQFSYKCKCGKTYNHRASLYNHKQKCVYDENLVIDSIHANTTSIPIDQVSLTEKILQLVMSKNKEFVSEIVSTITHSNKEVIAKMVEMMPKMGNHNNNTTNSHNTNNNNFNIQMFLNEQCKNAMNLTDFIESLPITSDTYDSTIENGLTKTITTMITNGLSQLDILERPIHCTDTSRKTLYVKDDNIWEKDNELHHIMKGITDLSLKQRTMITNWQDANIGWDTKENLQSRMTKLIFNSMTTIENDEKETGKIIRAISKHVYLDNNTRDQYGYTDRKEK
jgi:hypothetical protein